MKQYIKSCAAIALAAFAITACNDDVNPAADITEGEGSLALSSLSVDVSVAEKVMYNAPASNGASRAAVDLSNFNITITNAAGKTVKSFKYADMPEIIALPVATGYSINVKSHDVQKAEWDKPYYLGTAKFDITEGGVTEIGKVTCAFSNIKVSVKYHESIAGKLGDDLRVRVVVNDEGMLEFTPGETRSAYFQAVDGSTTLVATLSGTIAGNHEEAQVVLDDVAAGQHRVITFKPKELPVPDVETGYVDPSGVGIDYSVDVIDLNSNGTTEEDLIDNPEKPGQEEWPDDPEKPEDPVGPSDPESNIEIEGGDLSFEEPNSIAEFGDGEGQKPAVVQIKSEQPILDLFVTIASTSSEFLDAVDDLMPLEFNLADPKDPDYPDLAEGLASIGLKVKEEVRGQNEVPFDITGLVPLLTIYDGQHKFSLTVVDDTKASETRTITFVK